MWICRNILPMKTGEKIKKGICLDSNGFTMTEIILVLAIGALLSAVGLAGFSYISYGNTKKAAETIVNSLSEVQMKDMTEKELTLLGIFKEDEAIYLQKFTITEENEKKKIYPKRAEADTKKAILIADKPIELKWVTEENTIAVLDKETLLLMGFTRGFGAYLTEPGVAGGKIYVGDFWLTGRGMYHIIQVPETGKHYIEN